MRGLPLQTVGRSNPMYGLYKASNDNQSVVVVVRSKSVAIKITEPEDTHAIHITHDLHEDHDYARHVVVGALVLVGVSVDLVRSVQGQMGGS